MKVLITGGCGFLGAALARKLADRGHEVVILDRPGANTSALEGIRMKHIEADVRDRDAVSRSLKGCEWVFHTAALATFWKKMNGLQWDINVNGTQNVMDACRQQGVAKVVHTSSVNALGFAVDPNEWGDENTPFNWEPYHIGYMNTKYASEQLVLKMTKEKKLPAVVVNPGTIFGPAPSANLNANRYIVEIKNGRGWIFPAGGTNCVGLDDVVEGHLKAAELGRVGERYILGGDNLRYKDLFQKIAHELGVTQIQLKAPFFLALSVSKVLEVISSFSNHAPLFSPEMIKASSVCCFYRSDKAKKELRYSPKSMDMVLKEVISYLRKNQQL